MKRNLKTTLGVFAAIAAVAILVLSVGAGSIQRGPAATARSDVSATVQGIVLPAVATASSSVTTQACGQAKVPLGTAGNFRVLAGTTVTNSGATVVTGNLGVSPGSAVTGFPPGIVTGSIHKADLVAGNAQLDLTTAYNNAMGRTNCPIAVHGNQGGKTLGPGLYRSSSSLAISSGDLTLTAHGHSGAVFIFQIVTKFTTTTGRKVILAGGAQAANIFWVVGSSATLGTTSVVYGNILAHKSISLATGATLHGRALAHIGAVTMQGNKISHAPVLVIAPGNLAAPAMSGARSFA